MPLSLAEVASQTKEPLKKGIINGLIKESVIADIIDWNSTNSLTVSGTRRERVILPEFIPINGDIPEKTVDAKPLSFSVYEMAVHVDIPIALQMDQNLQARPETFQMEAVIEGAAYKINDQFVNGDQASDPHGFEGIEKLVGQLGSAQTIGTSELDISGAPTSAVMHSVLDRIDEGIHAINGHKPTFGLVNDTFGMRFRSILRREGLLGDNHDWVRDGFPFGNIRSSLGTKTTEPLFVYQGIPFYDIGPSANATTGLVSKSTRIIGNAYAEASSSAATRVYLVKLGDNDLEGLQYSAPETMRIGILEAKNAVRHRYVHRMGLGLWRPDSIVKVAGIKVA